MIRTGSYGVERKNLVNNLFKNIIDVSFPNIVKWLFKECDHNQNIFELVENKGGRKMSKYK